MTAYAYLRKSSVRDGDRDTSHESQETAVRELAKRYNDNGSTLTILADWDISGRLGPDRRPGYRALLEAIESGRATAVYSYSLSRLGRSLRELTRLIDLCDKQGIPVRLYVDSLDTSTASGRLLAHVLGSVAQFEADVAAERQRASQAAKRARGEKIGTTPVYGEREGEDAAIVSAAVMEAGSYSGAAKLLNERGIKPRSSKRGWWASSVSVVMKRIDPDVHINNRGPKGIGPDFILAKVLRCPTCGTRLTGMADRTWRTSGPRVRYACRQGSVTPHARTSVSEHLILPAIRAEADRLVTPEMIEAGDTEAEQRAELEHRKARVLDMFEAGHIDRDERERRLTGIYQSLEKLDARRVVNAIPRIDWTWPSRQINAVLRALFERIELDPATFQPVAFEWTVPEWRASGT